MVRQLLVVLAWCVSERTTEFSSQQIGDALYSCPARPTLAGVTGATVCWLVSAFGGVHCGDKGHLDLVTNEQLRSDTLPVTVQSAGDDDVPFDYATEVSVRTAAK